MSSPVPPTPSEKKLGKRRAVSPLPPSDPVIAELWEKPSLGTSRDRVGTGGALASQSQKDKGLGKGKKKGDKLSKAQGLTVEDGNGEAYEERTEEKKMKKGTKGDKKGKVKGKAPVSEEDAEEESQKDQKKKVPRIRRKKDDPRSPLQEAAVESHAQTVLGSFKTMFVQEEEEELDSEDLEESDEALHEGNEHEKFRHVAKVAFDWPDHDSLKTLDQFHFQHQQDFKPSTKYKYTVTVKKREVPRDENEGDQEEQEPVSKEKKPKVAKAASRQVLSPTSPVKRRRRAIRDDVGEEEEENGRRSKLSKTSTSTSSGIKPPVAVSPTRQPRGYGDRTLNKAIFTTGDSSDGESQTK